MLRQRRRYGPSVTEWVRLAVGLVALLAIAVAVSWVGRLGRQRDLLTAALRAVFAAPLAAVAVVAVMFTVATWTAARRLRGTDGALPAVMLSCAAGASVVIAIVV